MNHARPVQHRLIEEGLKMSKGVKIAVGLFVLYILYVIGSAGQGTTTQTLPHDLSRTTNIYETSLSKKGEKIKAKYPTWSNEICNIIGEKQIRIGMTSEQVRAAWGKPYKINFTTSSFGTHEQWVMSDSMNSDYVYFDNGVLTSLQQTR
jgi:hypothetical protein